MKKKPTRKETKEINREEEEEEKEKEKQTEIIRAVFLQK